MRISRRRLLCTGIALATQCDGQSFDKVRASIQDRVQRGQVPCVAVGVARHGSVLWEEGFGWADAKKKVPASADTIYSVASLTKPFTATGLMTLVQAGKINLDAAVNSYLGHSRIKAM